MVQNEEMKGIYMDLRTDFGFKHCMGNEKCMMSFLNAIIGDDYGKICSLEFLTVEPTRDHPDLRGVTFDLRCRLESGDEVIVEMQNYAHRYFKTRANYYLYNLMDEFIPKGLNWSDMRNDIPRMIGIFILGVPLDDLVDVVTVTAECDMDTGAQFWDRMRKYFISLPNFQLNENSSEYSFRDVWLETIKNLGNMERLDPKVYERADEALLKLIEKAKVSALSPEEYAQYQAELKILSNWGTPEKYGYDRGQRDALKAVAHTMQEKGYSIKEIAAVTGLPSEDIL